MAAKKVDRKSRVRRVLQLCRDLDVLPHEVLGLSELDHLRSVGRTDDVLGAFQRTGRHEYLDNLADAVADAMCRLDGR